MKQVRPTQTLFCRSYWGARSSAPAQHGTQACQMVSARAQNRYLSQLSRTVRSAKAGLFRAKVRESSLGPKSCNLHCPNLPRHIAVRCRSQRQHKVSAVYCWGWRSTGGNQDLSRTEAWWLRWKAYSHYAATTSTDSSERQNNPKSRAKWSRPLTAMSYDVISPQTPLHHRQQAQNWLPPTSLSHLSAFVAPR